MKFTVVTVFSLLVGTTVAAPATIAGSTLDIDASATPTDLLAARDETSAEGQLGKWAPWCWLIPFPSCPKKTLEELKKDPNAVVQRRGVSAFNDTGSAVNPDLAGILPFSDEVEQYFYNHTLLEALEEYLPDTFEEFSSILALDGDGSTGKQLATRMMIPIGPVAGGIAAAAAWVMFLEFINHGSSNKARGLDNLGSGTKYRDLPSFAKDLPTIKFPEDVAEYFSKHTIHEAIEEYFPEGVENFTTSLTASDDNDSASTPNGAVERRFVWVAAGIYAAYTAIWTVAILVTAQPIINGIPAQRRSLDGVGSAFDPDLAKVLLENLGEPCPGIFGPVCSFVTGESDVSGAISARSTSDATD